MAIQILNISKDGYFVSLQGFSIAYLVVKKLVKPQLHCHKNVAFPQVSIVVPFHVSQEVTQKN